MSRTGLSRRAFMKMSAGAAAASMLAPYALPAFSQDTVNLRVAMWDGIEVKPTEDAVMEGFAEQFGAMVDFEFNPDEYDTRLLAGLVSRNGLQDITEFVEGDSPLDLSLYYEQILKLGPLAWFGL